MSRARVTSPKFNIEDLSLDEMEVLHLLLTAQNSIDDQCFKMNELSEAVAEAIKPFGKVTATGGSANLKLKVIEAFNSWSVHRK